MTIEEKTFFLNPLGHISIAIIGQSKGPSQVAARQL